MKVGWKQAAVIGVFMAGLLASWMTQAASFDCKSEKLSNVEKQICASKSLSKLDDELGALYKVKREKASAPRKFLLKWQQLRWLGARNKCTKDNCLSKLYRQRIDYLRHDYRYALVMNKNAKLCNHLFENYNSDMLRSGEVNYDHGVFSSISWDYNVGVGFGKKAVFDINNDGVPNFVVLRSLPMSKTYDDYLYVFSIDANSHQYGGSYPNDQAGLNRAIKIINFSEYKLNYVPVRLRKSIKNRMRKWLSGAARKFPIYIELGPPSVLLDPFIFNGSSYLSMTDSAPEWIVVAKLDKSYQPHDICYYYNPDI